MLTHPTLRLHVLNSTSIEGCASLALLGAAYNDPHKRRRKGLRMDQDRDSDREKQAGVTLNWKCATKSVNN
jgi:hypothetical protein